MKIFRLLTLLMFLPAQTRAVEIFLEENRSETGTIGYVDIDRVFKEYSGTSASRNSLNEQIDRKEAAAEKLRNDIYSLKAETTKLRQEKELAATIPEMIEARRKISEASERLKREMAANIAAEATLNQTKGDMPQTTQTQAGEAAVQADTSAATAVTAAKDTGAIQPDKQSGADIAQEQVPIPDLPVTKTVFGNATSSATAEGIQTVEIPGIGSFKFSVSTSPAEIEARINKIEEDIKISEQKLKDFQIKAEKELLEYEDSKTKLILGKIYTALKRLSAQEGVSVVIDKRNILYGTNTVDLTKRLLKLLETEEDKQE